MPPLVRKTLRDYRRALIGWTIGLGAFIAMYVGFYPTVAANPGLYGEQGLAAYPDAVRDIMGLADLTSGAGYAQATVYQLFGPLLAVMAAVVLGNRAIAQPEESGTLELTLTLPIDRGRLVLQRARPGQAGARWRRRPPAPEGARRGTRRAPPWPRSRRRADRGSWPGSPPTSGPEPATARPAPGASGHHTPTSRRSNESTAVRDSTAVAAASTRKLHTGNPAMSGGPSR
jgi:hypothetical protein